MSQVPPDDPLRDVDPWVAMADGRGQLLRAVEALDDAAAARPVHPEARWSAADLLTHVAAWDERAAACLRALVAARPTGDDGGGDAEAWSEAAIAGARGVPLAERVARLHAARAALHDAADAVPPARHHEPIATPWGLRETVTGILVSQAIHDGIHAETLAAIVAEGRP